MTVQAIFLTRISIFYIELKFNKVFLSEVLMNDR